MQEISVVPFYVYVHTSGRQASIWGACPWTSEAERQEWAEECRGWTWRVVGNDGSVTEGLSRPPAKTWEEADKTARKFVENIPNSVYV